MVRLRLLHELLPVGFVSCKLAGASASEPLENSRNAMAAADAHGYERIAAADAT
jgi:hypothetical protein